MPGSPPLIQTAAAALVGGSGGSGSGGVVGGSGLVPLPPPPPFLSYPAPEALLHYSFPSEADTLAYVDALKHSDLSDWRSLQE
ncbi:hypothetical protein Pcinc_036661, partial [Petrolisthes cinctipes]